MADHKEKPPVERTLLYLLLGIIVVVLAGAYLKRWQEDNQTAREVQLKQDITQDILAKVRKELAEPTDMTKAKELLGDISQKTNNIVEQIATLNQRVVNLEAALLDIQKTTTTDSNQVNADLAKLRAALTALNTKLLRLAEQTQLPKVSNPSNTPATNFPPAY